MIAILFGTTMLLVRLLIYLLSLRKNRKKNPHPEMHNKPLTYVTLFVLFPFGILLVFLLVPVQTVGDIFLLMAALYFYFIVILVRMRYQMKG